MVQWYRLIKLQCRQLWFDSIVGTNLALGKKCNLSPEPTYKLTRSESDPWDLTDGKLACEKRRDDRIWFDPLAVGWRESPFVYISIDLEEEKSIGKVVLRTLGGREQRLLPFPKRIQILLSEDGINYYNVAEWQKMVVESDDSAFIFLPENGQHYVYPLTINCDNRKARYVVIKAEPESFLFFDEIAVMEGQYPPLPVNDSVERVPFQLDSPMLWSEVNALWVCNNMPIFDRIIFSDLRTKPSKATLVLELPDGVELDKAYRGENQISSIYNEISLNNEIFNQYKIELYNPKPYEEIRVWLTTNWETGKEGEAFLYTQWDGGEQEKIAIPVFAYSIEPIEPPKRLHTSISWMTEGFQRKWPNFFEVYKNLGFNAVPFFPRYGIHFDWLNQARELGFSIIYNESPMHVMANTFSKEQEIYTLYEDGSRGDKVSLAYRGKYYQNEMKRVAELSEALRPDWIFFDLELFSGYASVAAKDQLLLDRLAVEQWDSVPEACLKLGTEVLTDLILAAKGWVDEDEVTKLGSYNVSPHQIYQSIFDFQTLYPQMLDLAQPSLYYMGDAAGVGDRIREVRLKMPHSDIIPWLTAGTYGEFPSQNMRDMVLEAFFNGCCGVTFYKIQNFNSLDLKYTSEAIAIATKVEDIIIDGQLISDHELKAQNKETRVTGLKKNNGEAAILVSNYTGRVAKERSGVVKEAISYKVSSPAKVIDLDDDSIVGTITPEKNKFCVILTPLTRSKAFAIIPVE